MFKIKIKNKLSKYKIKKNNERKKYVYIKINIIKV